MNLAAIQKLFSVRNWIALFPLFVCLWYSPSIGFRMRVFTWAVALTILVGSVHFVWRFRIVRWGLIVVYAFSALFLLLPSHSREDRLVLRDSYCQALNCYVGCRYVWGGAGYFGTDCSGLVQKGLEDGLVSRGLLTFHPALVREGIWVYWHRTTAKVLGEGNLGRTYLVETCPSLNALDYGLVLPGDLAVPPSGEHVMAYLGNKTWIAADPSEGRVTKFVIPELKNAYFTIPMRIVRWKILNG